MGSSARGAVQGSSVPCSRVSPQSWFWVWKRELVIPPPPPHPVQHTSSGIYYIYNILTVYVCVCIYIYTHTHTHSALRKYWNSKVKIALLAVESRHLHIWLKDEYETKIQIVTFKLFQHMFYQINRTALLEFIPLIDVAKVLGQFASRVFLSDQLCPVVFILQVLKAGIVSYPLYPLLLYSESCIDDDTHKPGWRRGSWLWEKRKQFGC